MKKFFAMLAIAGIMVSCGGKKKDEKPSDKPATENPSTDPAKVEPSNSTAAAEGVPTFSDPEVQKFANDYAAFMKQYKDGMKDPAKLAALGKEMQTWSTKAQEIGTKLASKPEEAKAWAEWAMKLAKEIMPEMPKM